MLNKMLLSILEQDRASIVVCDLDDTIVYMNKAAKNAYHRDLVGECIFDCHNTDSITKILEVVDWFRKSKDNNMIYTFHNPKQNKDVYMVALRDENDNLIGYYEKHEYRNRESANLYDFSKSLV